MDDIDGHFFIDSELAREIVNAIIALPDNYRLVNDASFDNLSNVYELLHYAENIGLIPES